MKTITVGGIDLVATDQGTGTPVLLVHGFPLDHHMWDAQIDALAATHRVIAPDLRGFGRSEVAGDIVTMRRFADDLAAVLDALGVDEPVHFCGLSMGGYIAWEFWRRHAARVNRLILCDTRAAADTAQAAQGRREMARRVLTEGTDAVLDAFLPKLLAAETLRHRPEVTEALLRMMRGTHPAGIAAAQRGMAERADATALLREIDVPALLIVGEHDALSPVDEMRQMAAAMSNARLTVIPAAGHMAPMENPEAVNSVMLDFLAM